MLWQNREPSLPCAQLPDNLLMTLKRKWTQYFEWDSSAAGSSDERRVCQNTQTGKCARPHAHGDTHTQTWKCARSQACARTNGHTHTSNPHLRCYYNVSHLSTPVSRVFSLWIPCLSALLLCSTHSSLLPSRRVGLDYSDDRLLHHRNAASPFTQN